MRRLSRPIRSSLTLTLVVGLALPCHSQPQSPSLTLDEALTLAKKHNGTIRAAQFDVKAAESRVNQAYSAFMPSITPEYQYNSIRNDGKQPLFIQDGSSTVLSGTWRLLDSGERDYSFRSSKRSLEASRFTSRQTLRGTLFNVTEDYYEALRAQELQRVAQVQISRAQQTLDQTIARIAATDAAEIERLQANADFQNAKVQALVARNQVTSVSATLKASIGFDAEKPLPELVKFEGQIPALSAALNELVAEGVKNRPDLKSRRSGVESEKLSRLRAEREAGLSFAVDLLDDYQFTPNQLNNRSLGLVVSYPLFDGKRRREIVRELSSNISADQALLAQAERDAKAEIESAFNVASTNAERLTAAQVALEAAQKNYEAAVDSRTRGAAALQQVLTAQASLLTAESNYINAQYDALISDVRLRLVTGRQIPGESNQ